MSQFVDMAQVFDLAVLTTALAVSVVVTVGLTLGGTLLIALCTLLTRLLALSASGLKVGLATRITSKNNVGKCRITLPTATEQAMCHCLPFRA